MPIKVEPASNRWIKDDNHLRKLRRIESEQEEAKEMRMRRSLQLRWVGELLHKEVKDKLAAVLFFWQTCKFEASPCMHDENLRYMAIDLCRRNQIEGFKASRTWIKAFKRRYGIVSRKITAFVTRRNHRSREEIELEAAQFVSVVRREMASRTLACFCNGDQSGFVKEMTTARSLAPVGVKKTSFF
ncbi:hypothetical protein COOONC_03294 [Cooperia oncophora]